MPVNVFGVGAIQTAYVSWAEYVLSLDTGNLNLVWPNSYLANPDVIPLFLSIDNTDNTNSVGVYLPNAEFVSVGQNVIVYNNSLNDFILYGYQGSPNLGTIEANKAYYFVLRDNTTTGGTWQSFVFGAGTVNPNVTAMAGYGLTTLAADSFQTLNEHIITNLQNSNYNIQLSDWAKYIVGTSSSGQTFTLPPASTTDLVSGFFGYVMNTPNAGNITVQPGAGTTLNNDSGFTPPSISPSDSLMFVYDTTPTTPTYWLFQGTGLPQILPVARGGTGASTVPAGFNNIAPTAAAGSIMAVTDGTDWSTPLLNSSKSGNTIISNATTSPFAPSWGGLGVLQVVEANVTTSGANVATTTLAVLEGAGGSTLSLSITPTYANSKIFLMTTANISTTAPGSGGYLVFTRDGIPINVATAGAAPFNSCNFTANNDATPYTFFYLDSPATTSSITYNVEGANYNGADSYNLNGSFSMDPGTNSSNLIAIEIGGF